MKRIFSNALFALALAAGSAWAADVSVRFGPPPPRREVVVVRPSPRHVWVPGYYRYDRGRYEWTRGYWTVPPRPGVAWVPGRWVHRRGGYVWVNGYWR